jgi:hypothetical protein
MERRDSVYFPRVVHSEPVRHRLSYKIYGRETPPLRMFLRRHEMQKILFGFKR